MNGDLCVISGRANPLEKDLTQTGLFREQVGCFMWLANQTRPATANAVRAVAKNTNSPRKVQWKIAVGTVAFTGIL